MGVQPISVPPTLAYVLTSAGERSGVDFNYLLQTLFATEAEIKPRRLLTPASADPDAALFTTLFGPGPRTP